MFRFYLTRLLVTLLVFLVLIFIFGFFIALVAVASIGHGAIECFDLVIDRIV
ncbi:MAG: hypothetical protein KGZ88_11925 [Methylomicrobium sp.]|nr:hypothetical protein [Methylomicrobium sp.]